MDSIVAPAVVTALVLEESAVAEVQAVVLVQASAVVEAALAVVTVAQAVVWPATTQAVLVQPLPQVLP